MLKSITMREYCTSSMIHISPPVRPGSTPKQRLQVVRNAIAQAESRFNREPGSVRLLGVSKVQSVEAIRAMVELGVTDIGESYVAEALDKQRQLRDLDITWHYIGRVQSNKTREIATNFNWVHSVDRLKIARRLSDQRPPGLTHLNICLQLNLQQEARKSGLGDDEIDAVASEVATLPRLALRGLMAIPRFSEDFEEQREIFARVRQVYDRLRQNGLPLDTLSMGMTADMEAAIAEGATIVRIGTALFGPRPTKAA